MEISGLIFFILGFLIGGGFVWFLRQKDVDSIQQSQDNLKQEFENLSNKVLLDNQEKFLELASSKFSDLIQNSDKQLENKKELIDSTLKAVSYTHLTLPTIYSV